MWEKKGKTFIGREQTIEKRTAKMRLPFTPYHRRRQKNIKKTWKEITHKTKHYEKRCDTYWKGEKIYWETNSKKDLWYSHHNCQQRNKEMENERKKSINTHVKATGQTRVGSMIMWNKKGEKEGKGEKRKQRQCVGVEGGKKSSTVMRNKGEKRGKWKGRVEGKEGKKEEERRMCRNRRRKKSSTVMRNKWGKGGKWEGRVGGKRETGNKNI